MYLAQNKTGRLKRMLRVPILGEIVNRFGLDTQFLESKMSIRLGMNKQCLVLFKQLKFWHSKSGDGFYKFLSPCDHPLYRRGDSWCEELKVSENTLRKYLKTLCASYSSKKAYLEKLDPFEGKPFASYFDRLRKITFYFQNPHFPMKGGQEGRGNQKNLTLHCGSDCASIYTDKTKINLYPPKSPLDQNSKKEVGNLNSLEKIRGDLDQESWTLARSMYSIWIEETQGVISTPKLTEKFAQKLLHSLKTSFQNSIEVWKSYCRSVASSDFLMGKIGSFKAWLIWVIREETITKIKKGTLGIKKAFQTIQETIIPSKTEVGKQIQESQETETIKKIRHGIVSKIGSEAYTSWFSDLIVREKGDTLEFLSSSQFTIDQVVAKYEKMLRELCLLKELKPLFSVSRP